LKRRTRFYLNAIIALCVLLFSLSACGISEEDWSNEITDEYNYAGLFWMEDNMMDTIGYDGVRDLIDNNPKEIKKIVFLSTDPDDELENGTLAFYPSTATADLVDALLLCADRDGLDLASYGLSNPVTLDDVLNKRFEVRKFIADEIKEADSDGY
jgi:hypothetical protein